MRRAHIDKKKVDRWKENIQGNFKKIVELENELKNVWKNSLKNSLVGEWIERSGKKWNHSF